MPTHRPALVFLRTCLALVPLATLAGCDEHGPGQGTVELIYGRVGLGDGRFQKPRAITIDGRDQVYVVDMTARIQVFDRDGNYLRQWSTPTHDNGRPVGMAVGRNGDILVSDTHYYRLLIYSPDGELKQQIGGEKGEEPGQFGWVTDTVQDADGYYYIAEYGVNDRIQKFTADGKFVLQFGSHGSEPGQFVRPQGIALDAQNRLWVADALNHRIQVFDRAGKLLFLWGQAGKAPGELSHPYGLDFDQEGNVYIAEFGNHRVQKFTPDGKSLGIFGREGKQPGELYNPWGLARDSRGALHVLDTYNQRVQRVTGF